MGILSPNIISTKHISYLKIQAMQTSSFVVLGLLLMVYYSNSFPQFAENAKSQMPCGRIRACMKPASRKNPICKNAPRTLPDRCNSPTCKPPPPLPCSKKPRNPPCDGKPVGPVNSNCKCLSKELDFAGLPTGHCLTKDPTNDKFYCYVNANSCGDTKPSKRFHNLHYSYQACWNQRAGGYAAPNCECEEWDVECQSDCIYNGVCEDNPYCWEDMLSTESDVQAYAYDGCICEDWDDQCWADCIERDDPIAVTNFEQFEPAGCYCQDDSDEQCFEHCLSEVAPVHAEP